MLLDSLEIKTESLMFDLIPSLVMKVVLAIISCFVSFLIINHVVYFLPLPFT